MRQLFICSLMSRQLASGIHKISHESAVLLTVPGSGLFVTIRGCRMERVCPPSADALQSRTEWTLYHEHMLTLLGTRRHCYWVANVHRRLFASWPSWCCRWQFLAVCDQFANVRRFPVEYVGVESNTKRHRSLQGSDSIFLAPTAPGVSIALVGTITNRS